MIFVSHILLRPLAPRALGRCSRSFESPFLLHHPPLSPLEFTCCWEHSPRVMCDSCHSQHLHALPCPAPSWAAQEFAQPGHGSLPMLGGSHPRGSAHLNWGAVGKASFLPSWDNPKLCSTQSLIYSLRPRDHLCKQTTYTQGLTSEVVFGGRGIGPYQLHSLERSKALPRITSKS